VAVLGLNLEGALVKVIFRIVLVQGRSKSGKESFGVQVLQGTIQSSSSKKVWTLLPLQVLVALSLGTM